jgi:hypothetical protein
VKGRERRLITHTVGQGKVTVSAYLQSHIQVIDMSVSFKKIGQGTKVCINSSGHRCVLVVRLIRCDLVDHYLSPCSLRVLGKLSLSSLERGSLVSKK